MINEKKNNSWKEFYDEALQYHKTAKGALNRPAVFTPEIIYNLASMSIEKYFMAFFVKSRILPENHTIIDLLYNLKQMDADIDTNLENNLTKMNSFQEICTLENYSRKKPSVEDTKFFIEMITDVSEYVNKRINN